MKTVALILDTYSRTVAIHRTQRTALDAAMDDLKGLVGLESKKVPGGYQITVNGETRYSVREVRVKP